MYSNYTCQLQELVHNSTKIFEKEQGQEIEIDIQSGAEFNINNKRRTFYKKINRNDETKCISHGHRKAHTIYTCPYFKNLVAIHLISSISAKTEEKYLTDECQQISPPSTGACLVYKPLRAFYAYIADSGRISVIADIFGTIIYLISQYFHQPLSSHQESPLHISSYILVSRIPRPATD